ncbi:MAG: hypothetical protein KBI47_21735 [Armatimonadetes bacterium]|nr:hypothetical protein [Armatimonadota bacterium]MDI9586060.1 hypothetical protein [Acidobacteriota bacterium]
MKIGYLVEGSTDRAIVMGLQRRLCPEAELVPGHFRGSLRGAGRRRELPQACRELNAKGVDVIVDINDANELAWHRRRDQEKSWIPPECRHLAIVGAPEPNINAWLIADPNHFQRETRVQCRPKPPDPKPVTEQAFGVTGTEKQEDRIADFVAGADLARCEQEDNSFADFLGECRRVAARLGCQFSV